VHYINPQAVTAPWFRSLFSPFQTLAFYQSHTSISCDRTQWRAINKNISSQNSVLSNNYSLIDSNEEGTLPGFLTSVIDGSNRAASLNPLMRRSSASRPA
jgi:hypothetical protein